MGQGDALVLASRVSQTAVVDTALSYCRSTTPRLGIVRTALV